MAFSSCKKTGTRLKKIDITEKTYKELTKEYLEYLENKKRSTWTIKTYDNKFKTFAVFLKEDITLKDINNNLIEKYIKHLLKTNRATSVNTHLTHLKTLFNYAYSKKYMSTKITVSKLEAQEKVKHVYSKEQLEELLREEPRESFMQYQTRIIIATFVSTGLRLSELCSLQIQDVDFNNLVIYSRHTKSKKARLLPISTSLKVLLKEWIDNRQYKDIVDTLFCNSYGQPMIQATLRTSMRRYFNRKKVKFEGIHQLRRTFITYAVDQNVDIISLSRLTGHSNLRMLDKYYVNSTEKVVSMADKVSVLEELDVVPKVRKRLK